MLSDFAKEIKKGSKVIDLGTGTGIIGLLLCAKTELAQITGVEIQEEVAERARRSIKLNGLENRFEVIHHNVKDLTTILQENSFDAIVSNPPYKKLDTGVVNENQKKLIARHEITASLEDFIKTSSKLLKDRGDCYFIHRPERLVDLIELFRKYKLEPKKIRFVYPYVGKEPNLVLIKATKQGRAFLKVEKPLYVYEKNGEYTKEILEIYHKEENK